MTEASAAAEATALAVVRDVDEALEQQAKPKRKRGQLAKGQRPRGAAAVFTPETARAAALKSAETRRQKAEARRRVLHMTRSEIIAEYVTANLPTYYEQLHKLAVGPNTPAAVKLGALTKLIEQVTGKPTQHVESSHQHSITVVRPSREPPLARELPVVDGRALESGG